MIKKVYLALLLIFAFLTAHSQQRFEQEIRLFEQMDSLLQPATGQILLYGSSTMRLWKTFAQDLEGYQVVNRGFGGSELSDAIYFFDRVVLPLKPSLILLYEGDNDITNGKKSPAQVMDDFKTFMGLVEEKLPETKVAIYSLRPSISRQQTMPVQKKLNKSFKKYCRKHRKNTFYIDVYKTLLADKRTPKAEYLVSDMLHLNERGYAVWTEATRSFLQKKMPQ